MWRTPNASAGADGADAFGGRYHLPKFESTGAALNNIQFLAIKRSLVKP